MYRLVVGDCENKIKNKSYYSFVGDFLEIIRKKVNKVNNFAFFS